MIFLFDMSKESLRGNRSRAALFVLTAIAVSLAVLGFIQTSVVLMTMAGVTIVGTGIITLQMRSTKYQGIFVANRVPKVLITAILTLSLMVPTYTASVMAAPPAATQPPVDPSMKPHYVPANSTKTMAVTGSTQPYVAIYNDIPPSHHWIQRAKVTCNFAGTTLGAIPSNNYISCSESLQSPTKKEGSITSGLDYAYQASVALYNSGQLWFSVAGYKGCESHFGWFSSPCVDGTAAGTWVNLFTPTSFLISGATLNDNITLFIEWNSDTGTAVNFRYAKNNESPITKYTYNPDMSIDNAAMNTGICWLKFLVAGCQPDAFGVARTAYFFQAGVGSLSPIGTGGWYVTIYNPSYSNKTSDPYVPFYKPAKIVQGDNSFWDSDFLWGGSQYSGVNADYNLNNPSYPKGKIRFSVTGLTIPTNTAVWDGDIRTIATTSAQLSPATTDSYEEEIRLVPNLRAAMKNESNALPLFAFYYDGSNIVYKKSLDGGDTWGSSITAGTGTGTLASDNYRWTVANATISGTQYITLLYWTPAGTNMNFYAMRGMITGSTISWNSPVLLGYTSAHSSCGVSGACAAAVTGTDTNNIMWAAFRYKPGGQNDYYFAIKYSSDGGLNWYDSWSHSDIGSTYPPTMALTSLGSGRMLWAYAFYNSNMLNYKVYVPGQGWYSYSTTITNWPTNANKQLSATTDRSTGKAYVAFVSAGTSGSLGVERFANDGTYEALETPNSGGLTHSLPSIVSTSDGELHLFSVSSTGKIYEAEKVSGTWQAPYNPFGTSFSSPDQLTVPTTKDVALWKEGTSIRYPLGYG